MKFEILANYKNNIERTLSVNDATIYSTQHLFPPTCDSHRMLFDGKLVTIYIKQTVHLRHIVPFGLSLLMKNIGMQQFVLFEITSQHGTSSNVHGSKGVESSTKAKIITSYTPCTRRHLVLRYCYFSLSADEPLDARIICTCYAIYNCQ